MGQLLQEIEKLIDSGIANQEIKSKIKVYLKDIDLLFKIYKLERKAIERYASVNTEDYGTVNFEPDRYVIWEEIMTEEEFDRWMELQDGDV